jgi:hypothetical protein
LGHPIGGGADFYRAIGGGRRVELPPRSSERLLGGEPGGDGLSHGGGRWLRCYGAKLGWYLLSDGLARA